MRASGVGVMLAGLLAGSAWAQPVLFEARTIVTGTGAATREEGFAKELPEVLAKRSGNPALLDDARVAALAPAGMVDDYLYLDRMTDLPHRDEQGFRDRPYVLVAHFDPAKVDAALAGLGETPWVGERPRLFVRVEIEARDARYPLSADGDDSERQRQALLAASERFGFPLVLPRVGEAGGAAAGALAISGTMRWSQADYGWNGAWRGPGGESWGVKGVSFDAAYRNLVEGAMAIASGHALPGMGAIAAVLAPTGRLRVGVYPGSPLSMVREAAAGEERGVTIDLGHELARRLGVPYAQVAFVRVADVLEAMRAGDVDFAVTNATPVRAKDVTFSQTLLSFELGFLVPAGSTLSSAAQVDQPSLRIGVIQGSTSSRTLPGMMKSASVVVVPSVEEAARVMARRELDVFATNKPTLFEMADSVPGARVLEGRWGEEHVAAAIPRGRETASDYLRAFVADVQSDGVLARAVARAGLRGSIVGE